MIYEIDLLSEGDLKLLNQELKSFNYIDGSISNPSKIKKNLMCFDGKAYGDSCNFIQQIMHQKMYSIYAMRSISQIYFLKYNIGHKYDYHLDNYPIAGVHAHYSMTIFLNDDYEGGELVIKVGDVETVHKPKAGKAILYSTGLCHKVNPVTKGIRNVAVTWIESIITNSFMRSWIIDYGRYIEGSVDEKLEQMRLNLIREYGTNI
jgi:PKHD-type hydroxylase